MGLHRLGPPEELVLRLAREWRIPNFVETGTLRGGTAAWAAQHFPRVWTIEASAEFHEQARARHGGKENIRFVLGNSRVELARIIATLDGPALFWLDAHWSGRTTYGADDQCPLLAEIDNVARCRHPSYLLIDDARFFLSPPPPPHRVEQWPDLATVLAAVNHPVPRYVAVNEDVIVAVPVEARSVVVAYCQEVNAAAWDRRRDAQRVSGLRTGLGLIRTDLAGRMRRLVRQNWK